MVEPERRRSMKEVDGAIAKYEAARLELEHFKLEHAKVVAQLDALQARADRAYDDAKQAYGKHHQVLGEAYNGFTIQERRSVNGELLVKQWPDAIMLVKYQMSVEALEKLVDDGVLEEGIAEQCIDVAVSVRGPKR